MGVAGIAREFEVQLAIRADVHGPSLALWSRIHAHHLVQRLPLTGVFAEEHRVIHHGSRMQVRVALSAVLASHLDVVVFSNDEVSVNFLDNALFRGGHLRRHLLFL